MAEKRSTALWRTAIPLSQAWLELATTELRDTYEALVGWDRSINATTELPDDAGILGRLVSAVAIVGKAHVEKSACESELKADLLRRIETGQFELLGYRVAPTKGREPVSISKAELKKYVPDWREESLRVRDEVYLDLRVCRAELRDTGVKRGRPGSTDAVLAAIEELCSQPKSDFCKISRPQACERVRELLRKKGIGTEQLGNGLSDQNVAKLILRKCPKRRIKSN